MYKSLLFFLAIGLVSCNEVNDSVSEDSENRSAIETAKPDSLPVQKTSINEFSGKLFLLGQGIDDKTCKIVDECDCCNSDLLFTSSFEFILNELCEGSEYVTKGKYAIKGDSLILQFEPLLISYEYNPEREVDSTAVEYILTSKKKDLMNYNFAIEKCNEEIMIAMRSKEGDIIGKFNPTSSNDVKIKDLKEKMIWQKLEMK